MKETHIVLHEPSSDALATAREELVALRDRADEAEKTAIPVNTRLAYELELHCFTSWCTRHGLRAAPATGPVVRLYLRELADTGRRAEDLPRGRPRGPLGYSALMRALSAICTSNVHSGVPSIWKDPLIIAERKAIAFEKTMAPKKPKRAIGSAESLLFRICDQMDDSKRGVRDRALILVGWYGARRQSEIVAARVEHFELTEAGNYKWVIPRSKTDQAGQGHTVLVPFGDDPRYCPVRALKRWLEVAGIERGPVFRGVDNRTDVVMPASLTAVGVSRRVQHYVGLLGLEPHDFGGHSLRRGLITTASRLGRSMQDIMKVTGHRDPKTVMKYIEQIKLEEESAAKGLLDEALARRK